MLLNKKNSGRDRKCCDIGGIGLAKLIIKREKSMMGAALAMNCYDGDTLLCRVKNGKEEICYAANGVIYFSCALPHNNRSDVVKIDTTRREEVRITVKQRWQRPEIILEGMSGTGESSQTEYRFYEGKKKTQRAYQSDTGAEKKEKLMLTKKVGSYFGINEDTRQWVVGKGIFAPLEKGTVYQYEDIVDFELLEDGTSVVKGGLGRAVVGGFMFGGVGAVVGGITGGKRAHQKCTNLCIKITVSSMVSPVVYISLISTETAKDSGTYKKAYQDAQEILSLLQVICSAVEKTQQADRSTFSGADELRKWKQLLDEGVITREEFETKKRQLLDL